MSINLITGVSATPFYHEEMKTWDVKIEGVSGKAPYLLFGDNRWRSKVIIFWVADEFILKLERKRTMALSNPVPETVKKTRLALGLKQRECAAFIHVDITTWQKYESGKHSMPIGYWELFLIKTKNNCLFC